MFHPQITVTKQPETVPKPEVKQTPCEKALVCVGVGMMMLYAFFAGFNAETAGIDFKNLARFTTAFAVFVQRRPVRG